MEKGLLWLPLLITFIWLTWLGTKEYQKIQIYREWAKNFTQAKYDIYSVVGYQDHLLVWAQASPKKMIILQQFNLTDIKSIALLVDGKIITEKTLPTKGKPFLQLILQEHDKVMKIPFTEIELTAQWVQFLIKQKNALNI